MQDGSINCYKKTPIYAKIVYNLTELYGFVVKYTIRIICKFMNSFRVSCIL
jgi:hypothetical protein